MTNELLITLLVIGFFGFFAWINWYNHRRQQAFLSQVTLKTTPDFYSHALQNTRPIYVFLPPNYDPNGIQRYPVLYVNDGQDKEQLKIHETLAGLYHKRQIPHLIVVAIPTNDNRLHEYGTAKALNVQGLGSKAQAYMEFVVGELMPAINHTYPTLTSPQHTAILGASLGGLSAFDIAWHNPDKFGIVGVLSGSFWWRASADETHYTPNQLITHDMVAHDPNHRPRLRAWFEAGTHDEKDDRDNNGVIDAIQDTQELIEKMEAKGYQLGKELAYVEVRGGRHNYQTWSAVFPRFLRWAYPHP
jgi:enterochelin esterase-like enzyme